MEKNMRWNKYTKQENNRNQCELKIKRDKKYICENIYEEIIMSLWYVY